MEAVVATPKFAEDAAERARLASYCIARSFESMASARANFAVTQLRVSQSAALITAADKLIYVLDREIISRPDAAGAVECSSVEP
ncbi:MAG TPA: hypothetical protein VGS10_10110 [Terracidiphilus sp.]|nr:hypothetical protein [Terracidiphilus sp.]